MKLCIFTLQKMQPDISQLKRNTKSDDEGGLNPETTPFHLNTPIVGREYGEPIENYDS